MGRRGDQRFVRARPGRARRRVAEGDAHARVGRLGGRPRPGRLNRIGPPAGQGRWSLVAPLLLPAPTPTEAAHAQALQLVERYGVVTREAVLAEGVVGGFANVYGVLKVLEERGQVRRGYFVDGLGAAQFAVPGAVDRLRAERETPDPLIRPDDVPPPIVLAATDPGAAVRCVAGVARVAGPAGTLGERPGGAARAGEPLVWFDRKGRHLVTFPATSTDRCVGRRARVAGEGGPCVGGRGPQGRRRVGQRRSGRSRAPSAMPDVLDALRAVGFVDGYRGLTYRG